MIENLELERLSRRKAFSFLGLAIATSLAAPSIVLSTSEADAQTQGMERRDDRRTDRQDRRTARRSKKKKPEKKPE
jgi:hypothetical protein